MSVNIEALEQMKKSTLGQTGVLSVTRSDPLTWVMRGARICSHHGPLQSVKHEVACCQNLSKLNSGYVGSVNGTNTSNPKTLWGQL